MGHALCWPIQRSEVSPFTAKPQRTSHVRDATLNDAA